MAFQALYSGQGAELEHKKQHETSKTAVRKEHIYREDIRKEEENTRFEPSKFISSHHR